MVTFFPFSSAIDLRRKSCSSLERGCEEPISSQAATRDCAEVFRALLMLFVFPDFGSSFYHSCSDSPLIHDYSLGNKCQKVANFSFGCTDLPCALTVKTV